MSKVDQQKAQRRTASIDQGPWVTGGIGATFSPDRTYRYRLWRAWDESKPRCVWIMLNPSTADETKLDPTIRRCVNYARLWNCGSIDVVNLFAYRATDPRLMKKFAEPVGPDNNRVIAETCKGAGLIVAAWGTHGDYMNRRRFVRGVLLRGFDMYSLASTSIVHPLYQPGDAKLWWVAPDCSIETARSYNPYKLLDPNSICSLSDRPWDWEDDGH